MKTEKKNSLDKENIFNKFINYLKLLNINYQQIMEHLLTATFEFKIRT